MFKLIRLAEMDYVINPNSISFVKSVITEGRAYTYIKFTDGNFIETSMPVSDVFEQLNKE